MNKDFIKDLLESKPGNKKASGEAVAEKMLADSRFGKMFTDTEFLVDKKSDAYKLHKPEMAAGKRVKEEDVDSVGGDDDDEEEVAH